MRRGRRGGRILGGEEADLVAWRGRPQRLQWRRQVEHHRAERPGQLALARNRDPHHRAGWDHLGGASA